jgi:5-methylcytosine-specific restriction endonuclease McrA
VLIDVDRDPAEDGSQRREVIAMSRTLVLNASYEVLGLVSVRRAVVLVLDEKADVVTAREGAPIRSAALVLEAPSVIRLRRYVKVPYRRGPGRPTLRALIARDGAACAYCAKRAATSIDHIVPRSRGGAHTWENTCAACRPCNSRKADRTPAEAHMTLRVTPIRPPGGAWLVVGIAEADPAWNAWIPAAA